MSVSWNGPASRPSPSDSVVREWHRQIAAAAKTPGLAQHLVFRTGELLPRFTAFYRMVASLPRAVRRALQRRRGPSLAGVALLLALGTVPVRAATIVVDETACRLADAIVAANTDTAVAGCSAGSGDDLILLDANVLLGASLPSIASDLTITAGLGATVDGAGSHGCLVIDSGNVTLDGLTVRGCVAPAGGGVSNRGTLEVAGCTITGNTASEAGGGIYNRGTITIADSTISGNSATGTFAYGGGISNEYGALTIVRSVIAGNVAADQGGGLSNDGFNTTVATVSDSTISGNAAGWGGGVEQYYGTMVLTNCTVSGNTAGNGAGLHNGSYCEFCQGRPAILDIRNSTISDNHASGLGGGIATYQRGAAVLQNSTLSGNTAGGVGGGVAADHPYDNTYLTLIGTTVTGNSSGVAGGGIFVSAAVTLSHTIVAGNTAPVAPEIDASATADDYNVLGTDGDAGVVGFTPGATDVVPASGVTIDEILAPLADNGGPTETHAPVAGSPAVDAIPTSTGNCVGTTDQRGFPRPVGAGCDAGSVELGSRLPFGGAVTGFTAGKVICDDKTTGQRARGSSGSASWDCEALGLAVDPGDRVRTGGTGTADGSAPVGGSVVGMTPASVFCKNLTTGTTASASTSATSWDCEALGLVVAPGDRVQTGAVGTVDSPPGAGPGRGRR